jgi:hypothetical protein
LREPERKGYGAALCYAERKLQAEKKSCYAFGKLLLLYDSIQ